MRARKEFPKDSAWQSPNGPFRESLVRRTLPPLPHPLFLVSFLAERLSLFVVSSRTPLIAGYLI